MGNQTIRLGRILGLEISFNWSLLLFFGLIAWTMASDVLPAGAPGQSTVAYWEAGFIGALVFYACLLAHEISHALVARAKGVKVAGITLWLFGGVTRLEGEPKGASDQALITVVGPLTSLALAGLAYLLDIALSALPVPLLVTTLVGWLALLNLVLGVFNLVPALPLDGGRLLGALIWWRTGSQDRGIRNAVTVGKVFSFLLIGLGVLEVVAGGFISGIWLAFIGWFLLSAGSVEGRQVGVRARLRRIPASAAMAAPVVTIPDWLTVGQLLESGPRRSSLYALHDPAGQPSGFVAFGRVLEAGTAGGRDRRLRELATPISAFVQVSPTDDLEAVLVRLGPRLEEGALVMEHGEVVGTISSSDIARMAAELQLFEGGDRRRP